MRIPRQTIMTSRLGVLLTALLGIIRRSSCDEYCVTESFIARCDEDHVIVMQRAQFGRMSLGRCVKRSFGHIGCSKDVIGQLDKVCSGRQRCALSVSDQELVRTKPCPLDFSSYLEADYSCVKVPTFVCTKSRRFAVTKTAGYISSSHHPRDFRHCVYELSFPPGQRINITLIDFSVRNESLLGDQHLKFCQQYAIIEEPRIGNSIRVCGGEQREKHIYYSRSSHINLKLVSTESARFLFKYQALGCPTISLPDGTYSRQEDDALFVTCNVTGESFLLRCRNYQWDGELKNCSIAGEEKAHEFDPPTSFGGLPSLGISMIIVFGVALVIVVYIAIMITCVLFIRRNRQRREGPASQSITRMIQDPCGHTHTIAAPKEATSRRFDERLPVLSKTQPPYRANCGDYADICEMHQIGTCICLHDNYIRGTLSVPTDKGDAVRQTGPAHCCNHRGEARLERLGCVPSVFDTTPSNSIKLEGMQRNNPDGRDKETILVYNPSDR